MFDFELKDNLIFTSTSVVAVFKMEPIDIALLDEESQMAFFTRLATAFNMQQGEVQFNVVIKKSSIDDFNEYFKSLKIQNAGDQYRSHIVDKVITDMSALIEDPDEQILTKSFYFHIKETYKSTSERSLVEEIKILDTHVQRITGALSHAGIYTEQVKNSNLQEYIKEYL